jgi:hypothetical protein
MADKIYNTFLRRQLEDGMRLAAESDLLELIPLDGDPPNRYAAIFKCKGLVRNDRGAIQEANRFGVLVWFGPEHLRRVDPVQVLRWVEPSNIFHPNIRPPFVCAGALPPGVRLTDILNQVHQIITYNTVNMADNGLNREACVWARRNVDRFPLDARPLKRRASSMRIRVTRKVAP